jgi:hypothetical protein
MAIDRQRRIRLVRLEQALDHRHSAGEGRIGQRPIAEDWGEAGGQQHGVALAQRHIEVLRKLEHHAARRSRPAFFDEAHVLLRDSRPDGEVQLAEAALLAPPPDDVSNGCVCLRHPGTLGVTGKGSTTSEVTIGTIIVGDITWDLIAATSNIIARPLFLRSELTMNRRSIFQTLALGAVGASAPARSVTSQNVT